MEIIYNSWNTLGSNASSKWNDGNHIAKDIQPQSKYSCYSTDTYRFLRDNDTLKEFGIHLTIVHLPNNTNGSIGIDIDSTDFIVGDTLMNFVYPYPSLLYTDKQTLQQSCNKIDSLGNRTVYFGHSRPTKNRTWTVT